VGKWESLRNQVTGDRAVRLKRHGLTLSRTLHQLKPMLQSRYHPGRCFCWPLTCCRVWEMRSIWRDGFDLNSLRGYKAK
jgi:hypothetical protein